MKELEVTIKIKVEEPEFDKEGLRTNLILRPSIFAGEGKKGDDKVILGRSWNESHYLIGYKDVDFSFSFVDVVDLILDKYIETVEKSKKKLTKEEEKFVEDVTKPIEDSETK